MKKTILLIAIFIIPILGISQSNFAENPMQLKQKEIEMNRAKHCVTKKTHYVIKADKKGKLSKKKELRAKNEYNSNGMSIVNESFWPNEHRINERKYNEWNKSTELKGYLNGRLQRKLTYEYDSLGNLLRTNYFSSNGELREVKENTDKGSISTDTKGNIKKLTETDIDTVNGFYYSRLLDEYGNVKYENKYKVDKENRIIEWETIDNIQFKKGKIKYSYSEAGYSEEEFRYHPDGEIKDKFVSEYNDKNLEIKSYWYSADGILKQLSIYEYDFCKP